MRTYVRSRVQGGSYCFTVNLAERHDTVLLVEHIALLKQAFRQTRLERPFTMPGFVILPEHLHCLWTLPAGDHDFPTRWRLIKSRFSRALPRDERRSASRLRKNERGIWQRRFWEHLVRDDADPALPGIYPLQPSQTWPRATCDGLAAFQFPALGRTWQLPERLGCTR